MYLNHIIFETLRVFALKLDAKKGKEYNYKIINDMFQVSLWNGLIKKDEQKMGLCYDTASICYCYRQKNGSLCTKDITLFDLKEIVARLKKDYLQ